MNLNVRTLIIITHEYFVKQSIFTFRVYLARATLVACASINNAASQNERMRHKLTLLRDCFVKRKIRLYSTGYQLFLKKLILILLF